jgi:hypothetical protein
LIVDYKVEAEEKEAKERQRFHGGTAPGKKSLNLTLGEVFKGGTTSRKLGKKYGVSHGTIDQTKRVKRHAPELYPLLQSGEMSAMVALRKKTLT